MTIEDGLYQFLMAQPGVTAIVGNRIYRYVIPQNAPLPAIVLHRIDTFRIHHQEGASGLAQSRMQISCFSDLNDAQARSIADQVRKSLDGYKGPWGTVTINYSFIDNEQTFYEDETGVYHLPIDVLVWFHEQTP